MKSFCKWMDSQSRLMKILFCLPVVDVLWAIYRIGGAIANKNALHLVLAVLWIFFGSTIGWVLDLISILLVNHIFWFQE
ncbi:MAG: hypothetical protein PUC66_05760 [Erysipelotrichaceae bacterium]|nr:hypothetical protein [Erysipelotrichaceae bacterium]